MTEKQSRSSLKQASTRGVFWLGTSGIVNQGLLFVTTVIIARLLSPADFGLMNTALLVTSFFGMVNKLGLAEAIIQRQKLTERHRSTAFWANLGVSTLLLLLILIIAPFISSFFKEPILKAIVSVAALELIFYSLGSVHQALLNKRMNFRLIAFTQTVALAIQRSLTVVFAFLGFNVWALVMGNLVGVLTGSILMWIFSSWRPHLIFDRNAFKELFVFGSNLMGGRILAYFTNNIGDILIARIFGSTSYGYFSVASRMSTGYLQKATSVVTNVAFPTFSKVQQDISKLHRGYLTTVRYVSVIAFPVLVGLFVTAPEFVSVVYGQKWLDTVVLLQVLCIGAIAVPLGPLNGPVQKAIGRSDIHLKLQFLALILSIVFILVGAQYGIIGLAIAWSIRRLIGLVISAVVTCSIIDLKVKFYVAVISKSLLGSLIMGFVVAAFRFGAIHSLHLNNLIVLTGSILLGGLTYLIAIQLLREPSLREGLQLFWGFALPSFLDLQKRLPRLRA